MRNLKFEISNLKSENKDDQFETSAAQSDLSFTLTPNSCYNMP